MNILRAAGPLINLLCACLPILFKVSKHFTAEQFHQDLPAVLVHTGMRLWMGSVCWSSIKIITTVKIRGLKLKFTLSVIAVSPVKIFYLLPEFQPISPLFCPSPVPFSFMFISLLAFTPVKVPLFHLECPVCSEQGDALCQALHPC